MICYGWCEYFSMLSPCFPNFQIIHCMQIRLKKIFLNLKNVVHYVHHVFAAFFRKACSLLQQFKNFINFSKFMDSFSKIQFKYFKISTLLNNFALLLLSSAISYLFQISRIFYKFYLKFIVSMHHKVLLKFLMSPKLFTW